MCHLHANAGFPPSFLPCEIKPSIIENKNPYNPLVPSAPWVSQLSSNAHDWPTSSPNTTCCILLKHSAPSLTPSHTRYFVPPKVTGHHVELSLRNSQPQGYSPSASYPVLLPVMWVTSSFSTEAGLRAPKAASPWQAAIKAPSQHDSSALTKEVPGQLQPLSSTSTRARCSPFWPSPWTSPGLYPALSWVSNSSHWESLTYFLKYDLPPHPLQSYGNRLNIV